MSSSAGDDASAPGPSRKALGKRKQVDGDEDSATATATPPPRRTKTRPPPGPKPNSWESQPTGPWCNPRSYGRPQTFKRIDEYYLAPRAWTLPYSKSFLDQLSKDVEELLAVFEAAWHAHVAEFQTLKDVGPSDKKGKRRHQQQRPTLKSPLALFVDSWKQHGWHLVGLTWGEDERTRAAFFESTTRVILDASKHTSTHRAAGCLFALLLLYTCQTRWPDPVPGVKYEAFNWARPAQDKDGEWNPHAQRGINAIQIEGDIHAELLALVDKAKTDMRFSPDVEAHIKRLYPPSEASLAIDGAIHDVSYALSELDRRSAWQILPSSQLLRGGCNPPFLPLYEEIDEEDKLKRQGDWGRLVEMKDEGDERVKARPGKTHSLSRSDVLLVRAAEALGVPLETVFTWLGDSEGNGDPQPGSSSSTTATRRAARRHLEYDDRRPDGKSETEHRMMTKWGNVWLEKPFRPMELPRTAKWLGGMEEDGHGAASKLDELDEEIEVYMQLVGDLDEEAGVQREAATSSSAT